MVGLYGPSGMSMSSRRDLFGRRSRVTLRFSELASMDTELEARYRVYLFKSSFRQKTFHLDCKGENLSVEQYIRHYISAKICYVPDILGSTYG